MFENFIFYFYIVSYFGIINILLSCLRSWKGNQCICYYLLMYIKVGWISFVLQINFKILIMLVFNLLLIKLFELLIYKWFKVFVVYYCLFDKEGIIQEQVKGIFVINGGCVIDEKL